MTKPIFIAEVKLKSPFGWKASQSWDELFEIANEHGDWLSIHTESRWSGSLSLLKEAREKTRKPILAKGIHETDESVNRAFDFGADYVLVVGRVPMVHQEKCLIEPSSFEQIQDISPEAKLVWNQRDLKTGEEKPEPIHFVRSQWNGWLCQASLIKGRHQVVKDIDAFIVGSHLAQFVNHGQPQQT